MTVTRWICPLCSVTICETTDALIVQRDGDTISVETPIGRALRIEAVLMDHFSGVHGMTHAEALERFS